MFTSLITDDLYFSYSTQYHTMQCWYKGEQVERYETETASRFFFRIGSLFVKAEYARTRSRSQCRNEVYTYGKIEARDKKYFTQLLASSPMADEEVHWTAFAFHDLQPHRQKGATYLRCREKVAALCYKYEISDVLPWLNVNWFIHNGQPLIVDTGIDTTWDY